MEIGSIRSHHAHHTAEFATPVQRPVETPEVIEAVKAVNQAELFGQENELTFTTDPQLRKPILRIVNRETREVVRQIPPEYVLRLARQSKRK